MQGRYRPSAPASGLETAATPGVFVYTGAYDYEAFYLDDSLLPFSYSPVSAPTTILDGSPYTAVAMTTAALEPSTLLSNYTWSDLSLTKSVSVDPEGTTHIGLDFQFVKAFARSLEVRLFAFPGASLQSTTDSSGLYSATISETYGDVWVTESDTSVVSISESNISLTSFEFLPSDELGIPELQFLLNTTSTTPRDVLVNLTIHEDGLTSTPPRLVSESLWLRCVGATWVVAPIDSATGLLNRLLLDPVLDLYRSTSSFVIFRVG